MLIPSGASSAQTLSIEKFRPLRASLDALFKARNIVVHQGSNPDLADLDCEGYLKTTIELISLE
jgi:hypothetical protein